MHVVDNVLNPELLCIDVFCLSLLFLVRKRRSRKKLKPSVVVRLRTEDGMLNVSWLDESDLKLNSRIFHGDDVDRWRQRLRREAGDVDFDATSTSPAAVDAAAATAAAAAMSAATPKTPMLPRGVSVLNAVPLTSGKRSLKEVEEVGRARARSGWHWPARWCLRCSCSLRSPSSA